MTFDGPSAAQGSLTVTGSDARASSASLGEGVTLQGLCEVALKVLVGEGFGNGQLDLHLLDPEPMADLNMDQMGHTGPTDVLSFPLDAPDGGTEPTKHTGGIHADQLVLLGDVVLCPDVAVTQASAHVGSVPGEFQLLVIHGVLHILGHDHVEPEETRRMQERERVHLSRLGVPHPEPV